jgi:hypothetical protein
MTTRGDATEPNLSDFDEYKRARFGTTTRGYIMSIPVNSTWKLTFDDEFNGTSLNASKWSTNWFGAPGAITKPVNSAEIAAYDPADVSVSGGGYSATIWVRTARQSG